MRTAVFSWALTLSALTYAAAGCRNPAPAGDAATPHAAGQETSGREKDPFASVPRVTVEELAAALEEGRAVALDVRPVEAFEEEHIAGAVSIPEEEVTSRAGELPKDKLVVAYCA